MSREKVKVALDRLKNASEAYRQITNHDLGEIMAEALKDMPSFVKGVVIDIHHFGDPDDGLTIAEGEVWMIVEKIDSIEIPDVLKYLHEDEAPAVPNIKSNEVVTNCDMLTLDYNVYQARRDNPEIDLEDSSDKPYLDVLKTVGDKHEKYMEKVRDSYRNLPRQMADALTRHEEQHLTSLKSMGESYKFLQAHSLTLGDGLAVAEQLSDLHDELDKVVAYSKDIDDVSFGPTDTAANDRVLICVYRDERGIVVS